MEFASIDRIKLILWDSGNPTTKLLLLSCYEAFPVVNQL